VTADSILTHFKFTADQKQAATRHSAAIAVTAGAGSGKTRVLVGRYLHLLERGYPLRSLVAITFTAKAAREMRSRIRAAIEQRLSDLPTSSLQSPTSNFHAKRPTSNLWAAAFTELDAARIGTIHSLCAEVLRAHPAEAGLDPNFVVLEEGQSAAWQAQSIESALAWAITQSDTAPLINLCTENGLRDILAALLARRLDVATAWQADPQPDTLLADWIDARLDAPAWGNALTALAEVYAHKADDKLEMARRDVLAKWIEIRAARAAHDWDTLLNGLAELRKATSIGGQKGNWAAADLIAAREAMSALRDHYDAELAPLIGKDCAISWLLDRQLAEARPALQAIHTRALADYQRLKDERQALDFDDLEGRAARLLRDRRDVRERWQRDVYAVLVDEFQDTNDRQRDIVYALTGFHVSDDPSLRGTKQSPSVGPEIASQKTLAMTPPRGELFIVGDAKQSIYKFRGADVTVFRQVQADVAHANGLTVDLDLTFRAHQPLVEITNALLAPILGKGNDPARPYEVPFAPLRAQRQHPDHLPPHVEIQMGVGDDAPQGRRAAAAALAERLRQLHADGFAWSDIALLFRASTTFGVYEDALERAAIPFVTVAGRGFYARPEIRDVLNALAAIADPTDDLALAGLLRSPAIGLSDAALYPLRFAPDSDQPRSLWEALQTSEVSETSEAYRLIAELHALAGRVSVAEVLKRFLDLTHYRALLGAAPQGHRLRRNVDKLLADAHASRLISLGEFLEYVQTLQDSGVREGEAPVEAGGAVQLMTVHKAKGLEFPVVVIADAAHEARGGSNPVLIDDRLGLLVNLRDADKHQSITYRLAQLIEEAQDDAEDQRLLYVAVTRAQEKLIVNGHAKITPQGKLSTRGWLARLGEVIGLSEVTLESKLVAPRPLDTHLPDGFAEPIGCMIYPATTAETAETLLPSEPPIACSSPMPDLVRRLDIPAAANPQSAIKNLQSKILRIVPRAQRPSGPAWVVGKLVHEALRRWRFPDQGDFDVFLWPLALETGLTDHAEIQATINEARRLVQRFQAHPLRAEIDRAERWHEVPYALPDDTGVIDLLYRSGDVWTIVDFKTDEVRSSVELRATIEREHYAAQVRRYVEAVSAHIGQQPRARLIFLNVGNTIQMEEL
jgi:ATP-dependent helicase/nuclease subunit A